MTAHFVITDTQDRTLKYGGTQPIRLAENWTTGILNHFDGWYDTATVEGVNNKGQVITNRCHGVKSARTFFERIVLDVNRASEAVGRSIAETGQMIAGL